eukprot:8697847-Lingulodinium_polyedra.AAC.1
MAPFKTGPPSALKTTDSATSTNMPRLYISSAMPPHSLGGACILGVRCSGGHAGSGLWQL